MPAHGHRMADLPDAIATKTGTEALTHKDLTDATNTFPALVAAQTHAAASKTTPVDADEFALVDSAASNVLKKLTLANLKAALFAYIVGAAPGTLDTLDELAAALGDDANYAATISAALALKASLTGTETLTNKTVDLANNTVTMTAAQLQAAVSDADVALTTGPFPPDRLTAGFATIPRIITSSSTVALGGSGAMHLTYLPADRAISAASVTIRTGTTAAAATPTLCRFGLFSVAANGDLTLIASTVNDTALFATISTYYTKAFAASAAVSYADRLAVGTLVVSGAAVPTFTGASPAAGSTELATAPRLSGSVTGLSDLPSTVAAASVANHSGMIWARIT